MQKQGDAYGFLQCEEISCDGIQIVFFAAITVLLTHPGMYLCLVCSGAHLSIRVDKVV